MLFSPGASYNPNSIALSFYSVFSIAEDKPAFRFVIDEFPLWTIFDEKGKVKSSIDIKVF